MPRIIAIDQTDPEVLDVFARMSETELRRLYEPERGLFIAESAHIVHRALDYNRTCAEKDASDEKTASISEKNVSDKRIVPLSQPFPCLSKHKHFVTNIKANHRTASPQGYRQ